MARRQASIEDFNSHHGPLACSSEVVLIWPLPGATAPVLDDEVHDSVSSNVLYNYDDDMTD